MTSVNKESYELQHMLQMWKSDQNIILENSTKNCNIDYFINALFGKPEQAHTSVTALHTRVCMLGGLFGPTT